MANGKLNMELPPNHEDVVFSRPFFAASLARVAIILLIGAVELQQLLVLVVEMIGIGQQF